MKSQNIGEGGIVKAKKNAAVKDDARIPLPFLTFPHLIVGNLDNHSKVQQKLDFEGKKWGISSFSFLTH